MLSLIESCNELKSRGYSADLHVVNGALQDASDNRFDVKACEITAVYRVDVDSSGSGQSVAYGVSKKQGSPLGVLISNYGVDTEKSVEEVLSQLEQNLKETKN
ncbi:hypothetical protein GW915_12350 [bacterium]|nr:hypothetical protein [bacterium]